MYSEKTFAKFGLSPVASLGLNTIQTILTTREEIIKFMDKQIDEPKRLIVAAITNKLIEAIDPLGEPWRRIFCEKLAACVDKAIMWTEKDISFWQHLSFTISLAEIHSCSVGPDEFVQKVNACWGSDEENRRAKVTEQTLAYLGKNWQYENQIEGKEEVSLYFTIPTPKLEEVMS